MVIANLMAGVMCLIFAAILSGGNAGKMIAGYNTLPEEEKRKYDEKALCKFAGRLCLIAGVTVLIPGVVMVFYPFEWISAVSWGLFMVVIFAGIIYANKGNHFRVDGGNS